jgi:hypothetical protein
MQHQVLKTKEDQVMHGVAAVVVDIMAAAVHLITVALEAVVAAAGLLI